MRPTRAQARVLEHLARCGSYEDAYSDILVPHLSGQFNVISIDRSLDACIRRGWARKTDDECDYEITEAGRIELRDATLPRGAASSVDERIG